MHYKNTNKLVKLKCSLCVETKDFTVKEGVY